MEDTMSEQQIYRMMDFRDELVVTLSRLGTLMREYRDWAENESTPLNVVASSLGDLKSLYDVCADVEKVCKDTLGLTREKILPERMENEGTTNIGFDDGSRTTLSSRFFASTVASKKEEAWDWLRDNGLGNLIQPTVNAGSLSAALKIMVEEENRDPPEELFKTHVATVATFYQGRKAKPTKR